MSSEDINWPDPAYCECGMPLSGELYGAGARQCWDCRNERVETMASMDDVYGGNTLKAEELPENFRAVLAVESVSVQEFEGRDGKDSERKLVLRFLGRAKGLALNVTNANMMAEIAKSRDYDTWTGHQVLLYRTMTEFQGKRVPALRLDHATPLRPASAPAPRPAAPLPSPPPVVHATGHPDTGYVADSDDVPFAVLLPVLTGILGSFLA